MWTSIQKKCGNRLSFFAEIAFGHIPPSLPVPVTGIAKIALDAMQPAMNPCAFGARILLGDVASGVPFPTQPVPHGPEQGDGSRRRGAGLHAVKKDSDVFMHDLAFVQLKFTGTNGAAAMAGPEIEPIVPLGKARPFPLTAHPKRFECSAEPASG
jgi:hypothetical protein